MRILSIDTSGSMCAVVVVDSTEGPVSCVCIDLKGVGSAASVALMTSVDYTLKRSGYEVSDMDAFAAVVGPGSFTGLRVGIATINGLCYASSKPAIAVSCLEALAWNFPYALCPVCTIIDARQGELYGAVFKWQDNCHKTIIEPGLFNIKDLLAQLAINHEMVIFTGGGVDVHKSTIVEALGSMAILSEAAHISPYALGTIALKTAARGEFSQALRPVYLKMPLAVEKLEEQLKEQLKDEGR